MLAVDSVPEEYRPAPGSFLDRHSVPTPDDSYAFVVDGGWSVKALGDFPHVFAKAYSLLYGFTFLHWQHVSSFPWRGGFSAMHFFNWAANQVAGEHRPRVKAMQYASPGFLRFSLHRPTAEMVATCISVYKGDNASVAGAYSRLYGRISDHKLNDVTDPDSPIWNDHNEPLRNGAVEIMNAFRVVDGEAFAAVCGRPFEAAKIAMAFYRTILDLVAFEKEGLVRYPQAEMPPRPALAAAEQSGAAENLPIAPDARG
jgi:hypothetical protein